MTPEEANRLFQAFNRGEISVHRTQIEAGGGYQSHYGAMGDVYRMRVRDDYVGHVELVVRGGYVQELLDILHRAHEPIREDREWERARLDTEVRYQIAIAAPPISPEQAKEISERAVETFAPKKGRGKNVLTAAVQKQQEANKKEWERQQEEAAAREHALAGVMHLRNLVLCAGRAWLEGSRTGVDLLVQVIRQCILAWAEDVVTDNMRRYALLELR